MVEKFNERVLQKSVENPCSDPNCETCHETWEETVFDVRRVDNGEVLREGVTWIAYGLPPGAMYWADWTESAKPKHENDWDGYSPEDLNRVRETFKQHPNSFPGPSSADPTLPKRSPSHLFQDGPQLTVVLPDNTPWNIDSRASNCTMPYDYSHRCWIREGEPPNVTAGKNGNTCAAGAGSIATPNYHGFLRNGVIKP